MKLICITKRLLTGGIIIPIILAGCNKNEITPLTKSISANHRLTEDTTKDTFRNPKDTLSFFKIKEEDLVIEVLPSTYYADILTKYLAEKGQYVAALYDLTYPNTKDKKIKNVAKFKDRYQRELTHINPKVKTTTLSTKPGFEMIEPGTADAIIIFTRTHEWVKEKRLHEIMVKFNQALKADGKLGIVQHRAPTNNEPVKWAEKGYVSEDYVISKAYEAGFNLVSKSEVNGNPKYKKDLLALEASSKANGKKGKTDLSMAIDDSDRMTILFTKNK